MPNPVKGEATLTLKDGRTLTVCMDFEALVQAEDAYGRPLAQMMANAQLGYVGASRAMLWGALRSRHPEMTLADASALILSDGEAVLAALEVATEAAFPQAKAGAEGKDGANPPGKTSGASGAKQGSTRKGSGKPRRARSG